MATTNGAGEAANTTTIAGSSAARYRWVILGVCWVAFVASYMTRLGLGPMAPFMKTGLAITKAQFGFFMSAVSLGLVLSLAPAGWVIDRLGVRAGMSFGMVVGGAFLMGMFFTQTYMVALLVMFMVGLGLGFVVPGTSKGIVLWFPAKERAMAMGIKQTGVNLGGVITAVTLPTVCVAYGWRVGFVALGAVAIIFGILSFILYKTPPTDGGEAGPTAIKERSVRKPAVLVGKRQSSLAILKSRDILLLSIAALALSVNEFSLFSYYVLYLKEHMLLSVVSAGFLLGAVDIGGLCGKPITGVISDRLFGGRRKETFIILAGTATVFMAVIALLPVGTPQWATLICSFIFGFSAVGWAAIWFTMAGEFGGKEYAGVVSGFSVAVATIGTVFGVPVFGYLSDKTGTWTWSWVYGVAMGAIATVLLLFVREERKALKA